MDNNLQQAQQENLLTLLVYDKESLPILVQNLNIELLESFLFRNIAAKAINFFKEYKKPIAEHLPDCCEKELKEKGKNAGKAKLYKELINHLHNNRNSVNREYVLKELDKFIYQQNLKLSIIEAAELLEAGKLNEAEEVLEKGKKKQLSVFDPGIFLHEHGKVLEFLNLKDSFIATGIKELDRLGICPAPKELFTLAGLSGRGKTWWFIHLAKTALILRKKILFISLEMRRERLFQRFMQSFFAFAKRDDDIEIPYFIKDELDRLNAIEFSKVKPKGTFKDIKVARKELLKRLEKLRNQNLLVKDFPSGSLTMQGLKAYLENLINYNKFHPDIILLDSPDDMAHDIKYKTDSLHSTFVNLRGLADDYNTAVCVVSHINRSGANVQWLDEAFLAGAFAKMWVSDNLITFNQTDLEYNHNLARLLVVKGRNDIKGHKVLLSQNYSMGQFCLDSIRMSGKYNSIIKSFDEDLDIDE
jgi:replicative DNA helicase